MQVLDSGALGVAVVAALEPITVAEEKQHSIG